MLDLRNGVSVNEAFLDEMFDSVVARLEEGQAVSVTALAGGREELCPQIENIVRLAQQVAVGRGADLPIVPGYTILGELGHGGMGVVYLAQQERLGGRPVALKMLPPTVALSPGARQRFRAEALAIARLRHPHIVAVHDVVEEGGIYAYAMEWIDGVPLTALIEDLHRREHALSTDDSSVRRELSTAAANEGLPDFVCRIGIEVAEALAAVHREGLLHRDVKPSNVLLRKDGTALLSDFGLARATGGSSVTLTGCFVGTPAYAAPEQLRGENDTLDARADVYGLGATLYEALVGAPAFHGSGPAEILRQIDKNGPKLLRRTRRDLPADLTTIVDKACDPDPGRRYSTADELAQDLRAYRGGEPIRARPPSLTYILGKRIRRHRVSTVLGAVLVIAIFGLGAWAGLNRWSAYQGQFVLEPRGQDVQRVDVAILGDNVPTSLPVDGTLQVNTLDGVGPETVLDGHLGIGHDGGRHAGRVTVGAGQRLEMAGAVQVGCTADGLLRIEDGGKVDCARAGLGGMAGITGQAQVSGNNAAWTMDGTLQVGASGPGHLNVGPQAAVTAKRIELGIDAPGEVCAEGRGGSVTTEELTVGRLTEGRLEVRTGAGIQATNLQAAVAADARGDLLVHGDGASLLVSEHLDIGDRGTGTLDVADAGSVSANEIHVANQRGSRGTLTMRSAATHVRCDKVCYIGRYGNGIFDISAGTLHAESVAIARDRGSTGLARLHGPDARLVTDNVCVGYAEGRGVLEIAGGAQVETDWGEFGHVPSADARVLLTGAGSRWTSRGSTFVAGDTHGPGGEAEWLIQDGAVATVEMELIVDVQGVVLVHEATLAADTLILRKGATLETAGARLALRRIEGDLHLADSTLMSACSPGTVEIKGALALEDGTLRIQLWGPESGQYDAVQVDGLATLGGRPEVHCAEGFEPAYDDRFVVLTASAIDGEFGVFRQPARTGQRRHVQHREK